MRSLHYKARNNTTFLYRVIDSAYNSTFSSFAKLRAKILIIKSKLVLDRILLAFRGRIKRLRMSAQRSERMENLCTVFYGHARMFHEEVPVIPRVRQVDDVPVVVTHGDLRFARYARW